jgi:hypothetical protein
MVHYVSMFTTPLNNLVSQQAYPGAPKATFSERRRRALEKKRFIPEGTKRPHILSKHSLYFI